MWDASQYLKYADERSRPFLDLLSRVRRERVDLIADLGCGPGNLTKTLPERWPAAFVVGVDHSREMLSQAQPLAIPSRLEFILADIASWSPAKPLDLVVSNAALQWVTDHEALLGRLAGMLVPGGTLAVQMPCHFDQPAHRAIEQTKADPRWKESLHGVGLQANSVLPLAWYVERLHELGFTVDAWQTTYLHVLKGENPVLEWYKGTALRPLLNCLDSEGNAAFLHELGVRLKAAYPERAGRTLFPFPRLFFVATLA
jgi:trans-aconitate 2-methyltransferase